MIAGASSLKLGYDSEAEIPACSDCGAHVGGVPGTGFLVGRWIANRCACESKPAPTGTDELDARRKIRERVQKVAHTNPMHERFADVTLASLPIDPDNAKAHSACSAFVQAMIATPSGKGLEGFGLYGGKGAGKTALTCAVVNELRAAGIPALIYKFTSIEKAIRRTFGNDEAQKQLEDLLVTAPLLVIDDLGKEPDNVEGKWAATIFADIIDDRWLAKLPLIVSSNFDPLQLDERYRSHDRFEAILDRINDTFRSRWIAVKGASRRG